MDKTFLINLPLVPLEHVTRYHFLTWLKVWALVVYFFVVFFCLFGFCVCVWACLWSLFFVFKLKMLGLNTSVN